MSRQELRSTGGNCQGDDRQESCSSACGGIDHGYKIYDLIKLGVDAVQCYSVVAFRWMAAHAMRKELEEALLKDGFKTLADYDAKNPKG